jgi:hypothetical protein
MRGSRICPKCALVVALLLVPVGRLAAQPVRRRILPELRAEVASGDVTSGQVAAGLHITSGTYFRLAFLAGAGSAWKDHERGQSYRVEIQGRFHLDPFRDARLGFYGLGGVAVTHDPFADWQSRLVVGGGVELPAHGHATWAIESAFAGGFRISIVTRREPLGQR